MVVKEYSFDDAIYYDSMDLVEKKKTYLIIGFSNLRKKDKSIYLALTTDFISLIDENFRTTRIDLAKIIKITQPTMNEICIEYRYLDEPQRMTLFVEEGKNSPRKIVEELHMQIGLILARA